MAGFIGQRSTYRYKVEALESLTRDDRYEFHFADESDFHRRQAWLEWQCHCGFEDENEKPWCWFLTDAVLEVGDAM